MSKDKKLVTFRGPLDVWLHPRRAWAMLLELGWAKLFSQERSK